MTPERLKEIRERCDKCSLGQLVRDANHRSNKVAFRDKEGNVIALMPWRNKRLFEDHNNQLFLKYAHEDINDLLSYVDEMEGNKNQ